MAETGDPEPREEETLGKLVRDTFKLCLVGVLPAAVAYLAKLPRALEGAKDSRAPPSIYRTRPKAQQRLRVPNQHELVKLLRVLLLKSRGGAARATKGLKHCRLPEGKEHARAKVGGNVPVRLAMEHNGLGTQGLVRPQAIRP